MPPRTPDFKVRLAESEGDLRAAQRLRYRVFVEELGGDGELVDHEAKLERDKFDPHFDHLLLIDETADENDGIVGVYRVMRDDQARDGLGFYSTTEYDLSALEGSDRRLLELGRSCLHADYRGGMAMFHLWNGLASYVLDHGIEILFGVASFHGTDIAALKAPLSYLHHHHLAPEDLRVRAQADNFQPMDLLPIDAVERRAAMVDTPALIKAYLRLGGFVGEGAFIDHDFNTTDVCLLMDTKRLNEKQTGLYTKGRQR